MQVRPMPAQAVGGVPDTLKASVKATTATAAPPKCLYGSLFTAVRVRSYFMAICTRRIVYAPVNARKQPILLLGVLIPTESELTSPNHGVRWMVFRWDNLKVQTSTCGALVTATRAQVGTQAVVAASVSLATGRWVVSCACWC